MGGKGNGGAGWRPPTLASVSVGFKGYQSPSPNGRPGAMSLKYSSISNPVGST